MTKNQRIADFGDRSSITESKILITKNGAYKGVAAIFFFGDGDGIIMARNIAILKKVIRAYRITDLDVSKVKRVTLTERK